MGGGERPEEVLIGSVALDVSGRSPCPVAVVRGVSHPVAGTPVVAGVDDPATDAAALTVAFADAHRHHSRVVVLHAGHDAPGGLDARAPWTTGFPDVPVELSVVPVLRRSSVPVVVMNPGAARLSEEPVTAPAVPRTSRGHR